MRLLTPTAVFVIAILASQRTTLADEPITAEESDAAAASAVADMPAAVPPEQIIHGEATVARYNGYDRYRRQPDTGAPGSPAYGFKHFPAPMHAFTTWYRPRAATLTAAQRCAPQPFRPRGFGNLFARPCDPFRMEYNPHVLSQGHSTYGPSYLLRMCDPRCDDCDKN
ncbi:MAG: hypothetical protein Fues2KO_07820 [Fuerstiella sp.]